jgi:hypothetical protein
MRVDPATEEVGLGRGAVQLWVHDHTYLTIVGFDTSKVFIAAPDHVEYPMDTTQQFHTYRVEGKGDMFRVYVDGTLAIDYHRSWEGGGSEALCFGDGDGSSSGYSRSYWDYFMYDTRVNQPPVAACQDVAVSADADTCTAGASVDDNSYDPDPGDTITLDQDPPGPYGLGMTEVTLTVTDSFGETAECTTTVTVVDTTAPEIDCNAPATIVPPDAPVSFTAVATDNCASSPSVEITAYDCFEYTKKGKRIDKRESCVVRAERDTLTILDSGGVGDHIGWTVRVSDNWGNVNQKQCQVEVINPGHDRL